MGFTEQMKWLNYQIKKLQSMKEADRESFISSDEETNLRMLNAIKNDYAYAYMRSNEYSWVQNPDRMGQ